MGAWTGLRTGTRYEEMDAVPVDVLERMIVTGHVHPDTMRKEDRHKDVVQFTVVAVRTVREDGVMTEYDDGVGRMLL